MGKTPIALPKVFVSLWSRYLNNTMSSASNLSWCHKIVLCTFMHLRVFFDPKNWKNWPFTPPFRAQKSKSNFSLQIYQSITFKDLSVILFLVFHLKILRFQFLFKFLYICLTLSTLRSHHFITKRQFLIL